MTRVERRAFITGTLSLLAAPLAAVGQPVGKVYQVGHVTTGSRGQDGGFLQALEAGLKQLGYVEGQNLRFESRFADGQVERLPALMTELVQLNVDAIVAGSNQTVALAKRATTAIPIIMTTTADPVGADLVASLARPGGNITGLAIDVTPDIAGKRLALLKEAVPTVSRVAVLWEPALSWSPGYWQATQRSGRTPAARPPLVRAPARGGSRRRIRADCPGRHGRLVRVPVLADRSARRGCHSLRAAASAPCRLWRADLYRARRPLSYGPDLADSYRRAATYLDKIFRGADAGRPARRAAHQVRVRRQPQDREGPRPHDPARGARAGG